jgi:hypothetical protein
MKGKTDIMPTIVRKPGKNYRWTIGEAALSEVANKEKHMPRDFISKNGFEITEKCRQYLQPLIQGEDYPPFKNGLPQYVTLKNIAVKKKLKPFVV